MMNRIISLLLALFVVSSATGQKLESYTFEENLQVSLLNIFVPGLNGTYSINSYRVQYYTTDTEGNEHLASGLVSIPSTSAPQEFPLACYQHGTVSGREDVPSNLAGGYTLGVAFATHGYVVAMPDFVGLGISPGVHPYIHSATEASAGLDLMRATREMMEEIDNISLNDKVFISGYSQGGHAAMALQREIEMNHMDEFKLTASAPMSGPYSVSEKMRDFTLGEEEYMTVGYLAWLTLGYQRAYPATLGDITLEEVFRPEYIDDIIEFQNENITLFDGLNERMIATLRATVGTVTPRDILQPEMLDALLNDPSHPLSAALADNDNYDWAPQVPTNLYYCVGDDQVTYENAILAEEVMIANGSTTVTAIRKDTDALPLDHGGCVFPASFDALDFFDSFSQNTSDVKEFENHSGISVYSNGNTITVDVTAFELRDMTLDIYDMSGRILASKPLATGKTTHQIAELPSGGIYVATISNPERLLNITKLSIN